MYIIHTRNRDFFREIFVGHTKRIQFAIMQKYEEGLIQSRRRSTRAICEIERKGPTICRVIFVMPAEAGPLYCGLWRGKAGISCVVTRTIEYLLHSNLH